jgi:CheY-like chemotaxis protein
MNLFLVEDDALFAMLLKRTLKKIGFEHPLSVFENGLDILNYLKENKADSERLPDMILLDINMPIMDGWQFLDAYEEIKDVLLKQPEIYILSSSIFTQDVEKSKEYKTVTDYLIKPLEQSKLKKIVLNDDTVR